MMLRNISKEAIKTNKYFKTIAFIKQSGFMFSKDSIIKDENENTKYIEELKQNPKYEFKEVSLK